MASTLRHARMILLSASLLVILQLALWQTLRLPDLINFLRSLEDSLQTQPLAKVTLGEWQKPDGLKVIAIVFYGRRRYVEILNCYLQRNLVSRGGLLDEVIFVPNTIDKEDLAYLDHLVETNNYYSKHIESGTLYPGLVGGYEAAQNGSICIKIDDDIVFIEDSTIASIVDRMLQNPHYFAVSANIINSPTTSWLHYGLGAYLPYLPELDMAYHPKPVTNREWRASQLPAWSGPLDFATPSEYYPPSPNHRWLLSTLPLASTPANTLQYDKTGPGWRSWTVAAQAHASFLHHLETNSLDRFKFDLWHQHGYRLAINFVGFWGKDLLEALPRMVLPDDEGFLSEFWPKHLGRDVVVEGQGLVVHFAFAPQRPLLEHTDLLARYKVYADEMACPRTT